MKKIMIILLIVISATTLFFSNNKVSAYTERDYTGSLYELKSTTSKDTYLTYLEKYETVFPDQVVEVDLENFNYINGLVNDDAPYINNFTDDLGVTKEGLYIPESGDLTIEVNVPVSGYYNVGLDYYSILGRSSNIERAIKINGEYPFIEAESLILHRFFEDAFKVSEDRVKGKSDVRPRQNEKHLWTKDTLKDRIGYYNTSYYFYFEDGLNTITFESKREPFVLGNLYLFQEASSPTYMDYIKEHQNNGAKVIDNNYTIEAEEAYLKTSPSLNPIAEFSTSKFSPYEAFITRYNAIGGNNWRVAGDEIIWEANVSESGLYKVTFKVMQNFSSGQISTRSLKVNGQTPFEEAKQIEFKYNSNLQYVTLGGDEPMYVYLNEGKNQLSLAANIGTYGSIVQRVNVLIQEFRSFYREVVMRTGLNPDIYADYLLSRYIPNFQQRLLAFEAEIIDIRDEIIEISGGLSALVSAFDRTSNQLKKFIIDEKNVQNGLREFEQNISALGTWVISVSEQPLTIDQIYITGDNYKLPGIRQNFFQKLWHETILFFGSFRDNSDFGTGVEVEGPTIDVWIGTGRDQTTFLRQLIDESFTVQNNVNVNLKMVNMGVLLQATLSGNGPDVAIGVDQKMPVNWGIRDAIVTLSDFEDFDEVASWFSPSALEALTFEGKTYALPDTEDFLVMFYRKDILETVGITEIPTTWEEVIDISPLLQRRYLEFYIPLTQGAMSTVLYAMIKQYGGELYLGGGRESGMLQPQNVEAFLNFTKLFTDYEFSLEANFANRFRSGEMPIGIANYSLYNTLSVFAPEISGQWDYGLLPGKMVDGVLNRQTVSTVSSSVIMKNSKEQEASWEFMKWWLSKDTQTDYARAMEAIIGSAARYPTANIAAFEQLPWPTKDFLMLEQQRQLAVGIPTVPGDYIVGRHIDNAFRAVLNSNVTPQDSLYQYHLKINQEIERKRKELGL